MILKGEVLELECERLKAEGRTEREAIGQARGCSNPVVVGRSFTSLVEKCAR